MRQGEGARDRGWRGGMADDGERDCAEEGGIAVGGSGRGAGGELGEEDDRRWRWRKWRCGGPEAAAVAAWGWRRRGDDDEELLAGARSCGSRRGGTEA